MSLVNKVGSAFLRAILLRMKELGVNNTELARRMKVSRPYITKCLRGDVNFTFATAIRFAQALKMDFTPTLTTGKSEQVERPVAPLSSQYSYSVVSGDKLTDSDCGELSRVFSSFYGIWSVSAPAPIKGGTRIRMSAERYRSWYARPDFKIARCYSADRLVGQAIYLDVETSRGLVAFVVQLVVDEAHRHRGIAKSILHAAFGFSDYYAWAIVTSSPCTIAALEAATFRMGNRVRIAQGVEFLRQEVLSKIDFLAEVCPEVSDSACRVNTRFFTDRSHPQPDWTHVADRYGPLPEGYEWLAVIFRDQALDDFGSFGQLVDSSCRFVREAYARMPQSQQRWAQQADEEISEVLEILPKLSADASICDFGAGSGRHLLALREAGYANVCGIDFAPSSEGLAAGVVNADCRAWRSSRKYDLILCLYDVIGSFARAEDNAGIVENIAANLKKGGIAVLSVANSEFSEKKKVVKVDGTDRAALMKSVFELPPANAMSKDGEFFLCDALWDPKTGLFYHKEQFKDGSCSLPAEYLVVDRRYTLKEISLLVESAGMKVLKSEYVRAGFSKSYTAQTGKEILLICQKGAAC